MTIPCAGVATATFDPWFSADPDEQAWAKARCAECPIGPECLAGARARGERWGIWGGLDLGVVEMAEPVAHVRVQVYAPRHGENRFYDRCTAGDDGRACDDCRAAHALHVSQWRATHTATPVAPPVDVPQLQFAF